MLDSERTTMRAPFSCLLEVVYCRLDNPIVDAARQHYSGRGRRPSTLSASPTGYRYLCLRLWQAWHPVAPIPNSCPSPRRMKQLRPPWALLVTSISSLMPAEMIASTEYVTIGRAKILSRCSSAIRAERMEAEDLCRRPGLRPSCRGDASAAARASAASRSAQHQTRRRTAESTLAESLRESVSS